MARVVVVSAGLRVPSTTRLLAGELGEAVASALHAAGEPVELEIVELRELAHPIVDALLTGFPGGELRAAVEAVTDADALVVVSPTFSASVSGLFKSFLDLFEADSLPGTPTLLAATGGTERHSLMLEHALRPLLVYLGASPVRTAVYAATSDFGGEGAGRLRARVVRAGREVGEAVLGRRRRAGDPTGDRSAGLASDDIEDVVPFDELLADVEGRSDASRSSPRATLGSEADL
jgi:FMN reductase